MKNIKGIAYTRDPSTRGKLLPYEEKFAALIKAIAEHRDQNFTIIISEPWVIGDSYGEMVESLSRLADASLTLAVVGRNSNIRNN